MRRGFAPHFRYLDDLFAPLNLALCIILFRSCWVPFRSPPFSACRRSFCLQIWPNLSFYSDLVGSHFELRVVHPYWFWPGVPFPRLSMMGCLHCEVQVLWFAYSTNLITMSNNAPFCSRNVHISVTKWCIVGMGLVGCVICATGLLCVSMVISLLVIVHTWSVMTCGNVFRISGPFVRGIHRWIPFT